MSLRTGVLCMRRRGDDFMLIVFSLLWFVSGLCTFSDEVR
jgi:hypothetical protein